MGKRANAIVRLGPVGVAEIAGREVFNQAMDNRHRKGKLRAALKTTQLRGLRHRRGKRWELSYVPESPSPTETGRFLQIMLLMIGHSNN
jgi:hypothetical protein